MLQAIFLYKVHEFGPKSLHLEETVSYTKPYEHRYKNLTIRTNAGEQYKNTRDLLSLALNIEVMNLIFAVIADFCTFINCQLQVSDNIPGVQLFCKHEGTVAFVIPL